MANAKKTIFFSAASIWEIRLKEALGKVNLPKQFYNSLEAEPLQKLVISVTHAHGKASLPDIHRDPFDRMLIVQAGEEEMSLPTHDSLLKKYKQASVIVI